MNQTDDEILKPAQVARLLGVKVGTIYFWSHAGYIQTVKLGRLIRFRRSSIVEWLDSKERKGRSKLRIQPKLGEL